MKRWYFPQRPVQGLVQQRCPCNCTSTGCVADLLRCISWPHGPKWSMMYFQRLDTSWVFSPLDFYFATTFDVLCPLHMSRLRFKCLNCSSRPWGSGSCQCAKLQVESVTCHWWITLDQELSTSTRWVDDFSFCIGGLGGFGYSRVRQGTQRMNHTWLRGWHIAVND